MSLICKTYMNYLKEINFRRDLFARNYIFITVVSAWIYSRGCKFWHISQRQISADREVLTCLRGLWFF